MKIVSLLTDFGLRDGYVGVMKGVIWRIAPEIQIADISHNISPQNVMEGAIAWGRTVPYFPDGSVHIGVIDPGVGTQRRPIAARLGRHYFVLPDNGLISIILNSAEKKDQPIEFVHLDNPKYWLSEISNVFHGRDIFSPVGAHLAGGIQLKELGSPIDDPVRLEIPQPQRTESGWKAQVMNIDHFGNLSTNLRAEHLAGMGDLIVQIKDVTIRGLSQTFGEQPSGSLVALINSEGFLEIAEVNGSAARQLNAITHDRVEVLHNN
ncbi:MAG: SAM-dependent chlorinase/fluorinase [Anaerolineales bacterium]|nr:SAM-dependent chlorinase/fluorinase [Anaerolineales bacterium]